MKLLAILVVTGMVALSTGFTHKYINMESDEIDSEEHGVNPGTSKTSCKCGWANRATSRIVGGQETGVNQFPFIVAIVNWKKNPLSIFCGGTIISEYHVLTAAHCTVGEKADDLAVIVGEHNVLIKDETDATVRINVKKITEHKEYDSDDELNDIALLELVNKITFTDKVGPACMPTDRDAFDLVDKYIKVLGWGDIQTDGPGSHWLRHTNLRVIPLENCKKTFREYIDIDEPTQMCTFSKGRDSCQGDSGGPVVYVDPDTNRYTLVGLVSYGLDCATDAPGVNTFVGAYLDWIQDIMRKSKLPGKTCTKL